MKTSFLVVLLFAFSLAVSAQNSADIAQEEFAKFKSTFLKNDEVSLPLPSGQRNFRKSKSSLVNDAFRAKHPNIHVFDVFNESQNERGIVVLSDKQMLFSVFKNGEIYKGEFFSNKEDITVTKTIIKKSVQSAVSSFQSKTPKQKTHSNLNIGSHKKIYRIAVTSTGEFAILNRIYDLDVLASALWSIGSANLVFSADVGIEFEIGDRIHVYDNYLTDPFTPTLTNASAPSRVDQSILAIDHLFDRNEYDIGITLHYATDAWPSGGQAYPSSACSDIEQAGGVLKAGVWAAVEAEIDYSFVSTICREIGLAFGANHTMNSGDPSCVAAVSENDAYEIGAGHSIMTYQSACSDFYSFVENRSSLYFHNSSIAKIYEYSESTDCGRIVDLDNDLPDLDVNPCNIPSRLVPLNTPFFMESFATDAEDSLVYQWEQIDEDGPGSPNLGYIDEQAANASSGPLFRNYDMTYSPRRNIPDPFYTFLLDEYHFERLPLVPREINFACTVRDFNVDGGAVVSDEITVEVVDIPSFQVSTNSADEFWLSGNPVIIKWSDNGVSSLCQTLEIDIIGAHGEVLKKVAENIPFSDLEYEYTLPVMVGDNEPFAFRVSCADYSCFGIYNISEYKKLGGNCAENFREYFSCNIHDITANPGSDLLSMDMEFNPGDDILNLPTIALSPADDMYKFVRSDLGGSCEQVLYSSGSNVYTRYKLFDLNVSKSNLYRFWLQDEFAAIIIFDKDLYDSDEPCNAYVASNVRESTDHPGTSSTVFSRSFTVDLDECKDYYFAVTDFTEDFYDIESHAIDYDGHVAISNEELSNDFYYLVLNSEMRVVEVLDHSDFRGLSAGEYYIQAMSLQAGRIEDQEYLGLTVDEVQGGNDCVYFSTAMFKLTLVEDLDNDGFNSDVDCDDLNPLINPAAEEIANNDVDENCDGVRLIIDADNDGFNSDVDCDDVNPLINPAAEEVANNDIDENCDGEMLVIDEDNDGFNSDQDCDDSNASINRDQEEIPNNDIDENCDGVMLVIDADGDGFNSDVDCDDTNAMINPQAEELANNNIDENCDGVMLVIDADSDGFNSDVDCDDLNALINPEAEDIPNNGVDENCDGEDLLSNVQDQILSNIKIFPNPVTENLAIEFKQGIYQVQILNAVGQEVFSKFNVAGRLDVESSLWSSGLYYVKINELESREERMIKLIKI